MSARRPDRNAALAQYRRRAGVYDLELFLFEPIRRRAIERLGLARGDVVIDVGCGTGLSFEQLVARVGDGGRVIGIEQSPEMIEQARRRVGEHRWRNVQLVNAPVEEAVIRARADAALFHFTHDILRAPRAVTNVVAHLKPGARVVACGLQWGRRWALPVNLAVLAAARHSVSTLEGLRAPWSHLADRLGPLRIETTMLGAVFIASGTLAPRR
jgi:SAM-dependent methyltransferase